MKINVFVRALMIKQLATKENGFDVLIKKCSLTPENNFERSPVTGLTIVLRSTVTSVALEKHIDEKDIDNSEELHEDRKEFKEAEDMVAELQKAATFLSSNSIEKQVN